jgi:hypothetical protein
MSMPACGAAGLVEVPPVIAERGTAHADAAALVAGHCAAVVVKMAARLSSAASTMA